MQSSDLVFLGLSSIGALANALIMPRVYNVYTGEYGVKLFYTN